MTDGAGRRIGLGFDDLSEGMEVVVDLNYDISADYHFGWYQCPHVQPNRTVPRVVIAQDDCGYDMTIICLDCLLSAVAEKGLAGEREG